MKKVRCMLAKLNLRGGGTIALILFVCLVACGKTHLAEQDVFG
jgi:hypothetical protein